MRLFEDEDALRKGMESCEHGAGLFLGIVSHDIPLISNLDIWANVALSRQYHQNLPAAQAEILVRGYLKRYGLEGIAHQRSSALSAEERFCVLLLRAAFVRDSILLIDRPFLIIPHLKDAGWFCEKLKAIDDLYTQCYIFDYVWDKDKYRVIDATEC